MVRTIRVVMANTICQQLDWTGKHRGLAKYFWVYLFEACG